MKLNELSPGGNKTKEHKRRGRGPGSGLGKTGGRGTKGAGARKSANVGAHSRSEGGNYPLWRSFSKRGFKSYNKIAFQVVNIKSLEKIQGVDEVDLTVLVQYGLIKTANQPVKLLAQGELNRPLTIKVNAASAQALAIVEKAGGKVEIL